ncbi:mitochondrial aspartate aminotransferase-like protein [Ramicandelaber brevisporus]|nr:mitochondrial aspartate aminotransferase-like protein [Ramicandelaber brevisporus]
MLARSIARSARSTAFALKNYTTAASLSTWANVPQGPPDAILGITEAFKADKDPRKINLGVGAYRDDQGKPFVLSCVRKAEARMLSDGLNKEYLGITGLAGFVNKAIRLAYGGDSVPVNENRIAATQSISGTGALRIGGEFLRRFYPGAKKIYLPTPTWGNHIPIFKDSGLEVAHYRYYDKANIGLDLNGMLEDIKHMPEGSVVLLHACAHNPTGVDPTFEQWDKISHAIKAKGHFVFFDMAYQGFASGDIARDAYALRKFVGEGHSVCLSQSFAKNMGLYGERVGLFSVVCADAKQKAAVESQLKIIVRPMYSNPPINGPRIVDIVLGDQELRAEWDEEVKTMANRIIDMRTKLKHHLVSDLKSERNWDHVTRQIGMFLYSGLDAAQCDRLRDEFHIYMTRDGRISVAGVTSGNVKYLAESIHEVTK